MRVIFPLQLRSLPLSPWLCVSVRTRSALRQPASFEHCQFRALTQARRHGGRSLYLPPPVMLSSSLSVALCLCENQKRPTAASQLRALPVSSTHAGTETRGPMRVIFPLQLRSLPLSPWLCVSVRTRSALRQPASFEHCQFRALTQARRHGGRSLYLPPPVMLSSSLSVALCLCENQKRPTAASQLRALPVSSAHAGTETRGPIALSSPSSYALFLSLRGSVSL